MIGNIYDGGVDDRKIITSHMMKDLSTISEIRKNFESVIIGIEGLDSSGKETVRRTVIKETMIGWEDFVKNNVVEDKDIKVFSESFPRYNTVFGNKIKHNLTNIKQEERDNILHSRLYIEDRIDYFKAIIHPVTLGGGGNGCVVFTDRTPIANLVCNLHTLSIADANKLIDAALTEIYTYGYNKIYILHRKTAAGANNHRAFLQAESKKRIMDLNESEDRQVQFNENIIKLSKIPSINELCIFLDIGDSLAVGHMIANDIKNRVLNMSIIKR